MGAEVAQFATINLRGSTSGFESGRYREKEVFAANIVAMVIAHFSLNGYYFFQNYL